MKTTSRIVVLFRTGEITDYVGTARNEAEAYLISADHLRDLNVDQEEDMTWDEMVETWDDITDGQEEFIFEPEKVV